MSFWVKSKEIVLNEYNLKDKKVLDVGCGNGWFSHWANDNGAIVDAIDPSIEQIKIAQNNDKNKKINFMPVGVENINDLNNIYDLIFYFNSLHHIPISIMENSLEYCRNKINNSGNILIIEPIAKGSFHNFVKYIDDETEVRNYAYKAIKNCNRSNLEIIKELIYDEIKVFNNGEECINFLLKVDKNRKSYIEKNKIFLLNEFNKLSNNINDKFEFIQPMRLNILKNKI